jgi:Coproporphyrinogen III oxidase
VTDHTAVRSRMEQLVRRMQDVICGAVAGLDGGAFREDHWLHPEGGSGLSPVLEGGRVFEKAGVNTAAVRGRPPPGQLAAPGLDHVEGEDARFLAVRARARARLRGGPTAGRSQNAARLGVDGLSRCASNCEVPRRHHLRRARGTTLNGRGGATQWMSMRSRQPPAGC